MSCLKKSICQIDPCLQELFNQIENSSSLSLMILSAWNLARVLAVKLVEEVLIVIFPKSTQPTDFSPPNPACAPFISNTKRSQNQKDKYHKKKGDNIIVAEAKICVSAFPIFILYLIPNFYQFN